MDPDSCLRSYGGITGKATVCNQRKTPSLESGSQPGANEAALRLAELMDGKLLVVTNVQDMASDKVIERYKSLADIERGFKVLKSELEIGPVYHRVSINGAAPLSGVTAMTAEHSEMLKALKVKTPTQSQQLSLL